jgi:mono/diheme cytochrome c family protein
VRDRRLALLLGVLAPLAGAAEPASIPVFTKVQSDYLLACGGCHGENGVSNSRLVPDLAGQVGHFLNTAEGRAYLVRLPNVAAAALDDRALADVMNFMVWDIGSGSAPSSAERFTAPEVGALRKRPLNDVSLRALRQSLVETLIAEHGAPASLRDYTATP